MMFVEQRGPIPDITELPHSNELLERFGSLRRAFRIVLLVTDDQGWERVRRERSVDLLVHLACSHASTGARARSELPDSLQRDVRGFSQQLQGGVLSGFRSDFSSPRGTRMRFN